MGLGAPSAQLLLRDHDMHLASQDRRLHSSLLQTGWHSNNTRDSKHCRNLKLNRRLNSSSGEARHSSTLHSTHSSTSSTNTRSSRPLQRPSPRLPSICLTIRLK